MQIKPLDRTIKQLVETGFFRIPRFQRPYSWDKENVDDLWSDAISNDDPDYFIGSFVLYRDKSIDDIYYVVDGQQRLTTLTLLFAAVRNALDAIGKGNLASGVQRFIERQDINNDKLFILQTETSYPYLQEHIQKHGAPDHVTQPGKEEEALQQAFNHLKAKVASVIDAVDLNALIPPTKKLAAKEKEILRIRDNALRLQLIVVELANEDDAYLIFETLNTRGKDLGISDLVKNLLTRILKPKNRGVDVTKDKWNKILELFEASAADLDMNAFIYHAWLSRFPYIGREKLFRELKTHVDSTNAMAFLDDLLADAQLYRAAFEPDSHPWAKHEAEIAASLNALNIFRVIQPVPMTLAILRQYFSKGLSYRQVKSILRDMENFHVMFTAVTAQRTGGGTARMYASAAQALTEADDSNERASVLSDFKRKMRERKPSFIEFEANFREIEYHSENTKQKTLVQYLLQRIDSNLRNNVPVKYEQMSIEHIAAQRPRVGTPMAHNKGLLGNLILLPPEMNSKIGNMDVASKLALFQKDPSIPKDSMLSTATTWDARHIEERTRLLAKLAYENVFAF